MNRVQILILVLLVPLVASCVSPTRSEGLTIEDQVVGELTISLAFSSTPTVNRSERANIILVDAQGQFIDNALVSLIVSGPDGDAMPVSVGQANQGGYTSEEIVFPAAGMWTLVVTASLDGDEYDATFTRNVVN
jgi:hypothetical protein